MRQVYASSKKSSAKLTFAFLGLCFLSFGGPLGCENGNIGGSLDAGDGAPVCGNGKIEAGEDCDTGGASASCTIDCKNITKQFSCMMIDGANFPAIQKVISGDWPPNNKQQTLLQSMANSKVPGLSIAVRDIDGTVYTAVLGSANNQSDLNAPALSASTLFQAGSVSKGFTALAYLSSAFAANTIDVPINGTIDNLITMPDPKSYPITSTDLLSHSAGTTPHGFLGYIPGVAVPTFADILANHIPPVNSSPITFSLAQKGIWQYSGGGYMIWQGWLEKTVQQSLNAFVHNQLFLPAGAKRSHFDQPLNAAEHDAACGYVGDGKTTANGTGMVNGDQVCRNTYPELAAAGLWTTSGDLACMLGYIASQHPEALARVTTRQFDISPYPQKVGLGFYHRPANGTNEIDGHFFEDSGVNVGFQTQTAFFNDGRAIVVMQNLQTPQKEPINLFAVRHLCQVLGWTCSGVQLASK